MADSFVSKLISELTEKTTAADTDLIPVSDKSGNFFKMTWKKLKELILGTKDISGIGDGTVTGAISELNTNNANLGFRNNYRLICDKCSSKSDVNGWISFAYNGIELNSKNTIALFICPENTGITDISIISQSINTEGTWRARAMDRYGSSSIGNKEIPIRYIAMTNL